MATQIWVNIGSVNGLLPDGTKSLPEPILTQVELNIHRRATSQHVFRDYSFKITTITLRDHWVMPRAVVMHNGCMIVSQLVQINVHFISAWEGSRHMQQATATHDRGGLDRHVRYAGQIKVATLTWENITKWCPPSQIANTFRSMAI